MTRWFRMYDDLIDDPKVQRLPADLFKIWVNLLCLASKNGGSLPEIGHIAFSLRIGEPEAERAIVDLIGRGLIDRDDDRTAPHNWDKRQYKSDIDPTAADRQRKKRDKDKGHVPVTDNVTRDKTVTSHPPETETETETEQRESRTDHRSLAVEMIQDGKFSISNWEDGFLSNISQLPKLSADQKTHFQAILDRYRAVYEPEKPAFTIKADHPGFEPWLKVKAKEGKDPAFYRKMGCITVPTEYPQEQAA